ncbi:MAG: undecaprenyl/decaprenyl-phosphate alpha-N-acetylglucosaminyl 1-phosphate transferase [Pirellulales bacterium]|nr:undecaprenyl/decaprenyl-phosphate alpha-N-acetylglucosaminyl 1-phosphate transferase [Pirellulales bacterium]
MTLFLLALVCIALSFTAALVFVPLIRQVAHTFGIVDHPDSERKLQAQPIALCGGLAVFLSLIAGIWGAVMVTGSVFDHLPTSVDSKWLALFTAAAAMLLVGMIDDAWGLRGRQKLLLQVLIITCLVSSGTLIEELVLFGSPFPVELKIFGIEFPIDACVTIIWLLLAVNALNLIDGADGMATTAGCVICAGLGCIGLHRFATTPAMDVSGADSFFVAVVAFALSGALLGFLVFNRPPASIYLGDAGSMTIGLIIGVLAVWGSGVKETTFFASTSVLAPAPVAMLAIPIFDSVAAILRRWLTGRSIYATDRAHMHHLLMERFGPIKMLFVVAGLCITTVALSIVSEIFSSPLIAVMGIVIVLSVLISTRSFGHAECRLLMGRAAHFAQSFATVPARLASNKHQRRVPLQGVGRWELIWEPLVEFAKTHELAMVKIDLNLAWLHEGYHATWRSMRLPDKALQLSICLPLFTVRTSNGSQIQIGRLEIVAPANDPSVYERISDLTDKLADLGPQIDMIVEELESKKQSSQPLSSFSPQDGSTSQVGMVAAPSLEPGPEGQVTASGA